MSEDAYLADLSGGAALAIAPGRGAQMFSSSAEADRWLERGGWDYYLTVQHSDTADEIERWLRLGDPRLEEELDG